MHGDWNTLCPSLGGPAQATVACRQLNPGKTVIGIKTNMLSGQHRFQLCMYAYIICIIVGVAKSFHVGINFSFNFKNPFFCKGNEKKHNCTALVSWSYSVWCHYWSCAKYMQSYITLNMPTCVAFMIFKYTLTIHINLDIYNNNTGTGCTTHIRA